MQINIDLNDSIIDFCKTITGIDDMQEAIEHFTATCVLHNINAKEILNNVKENIMK